MLSWGKGLLYEIRLLASARYSIHMSLLLLFSSMMRRGFGCWAELIQGSLKKEGSSVISRMHSDIAPPHNGDDNNLQPDSEAVLRILKSGDCGEGNAARSWEERRYYSSEGRCKSTNQDF